MLAPRDRWLLVATAVVSIGVPVAARAWVSARTSELAETLTATGGMPARIGTVDADLTGTLRLSDVAFGDLVAADAVEASVALASLLSGDLRADEIRVEGPRVAIQVDADGDSDLARLARRLARHGGSARRPHGGSARAGAHESTSRLRRIVVSSGTLTAQVAGVGVVSADGVELVPDADGVRVITGRVQVRGTARPVGVELAFARSAAELSLPQMKFRRVLAVGGTGTVTAGDRQLVLRDLAAGRLAADGALELRATIDDAGIPRPLAVDLSTRELEVRGEHVPLRALAALAPHGLGLDDARATGSVRIRQRLGTTELALDGEVSGLLLDHRALAATAVPVNATIGASVTIADHAITVPRLAIDTGALHARLAGWLRRGSPVSGQLDVEIAKSPCGDLLASLPAELRGPLDGMVLDGQLGTRARLAIDLAAPVGDGVTLTTNFDGACTALVEPPAADVTALTIPMDSPDWRELGAIPHRVQGAFVSAEDGRFWNHNGFDLQQIARSLEIDLRERRLARGGSTISQQLIKNAFLTRRRTLDRKLQEAILTWRLEARLTKKQVLERYLNIIELGPKVTGIRAAAHYWFGVSQRELTVKQAAFLAALTSEPTTMARRVRRHGGLDPDSMERVATVLRAMRRDGVISNEDFDAARVAPMGFLATVLRADR